MRFFTVSSLGLLGLAAAAPIVDGDVEVSELAAAPVADVEVSEAVAPARMMSEAELPAFTIDDIDVSAMAQRVTCVSGVYMLVARGSMEAAGEGQLKQVSDKIKALIPGSTSVAINYPASIYDDGVYPASVYEGIVDAISKVKAYVSACGASSRIVLLGYSQGGNVMTNVLAGGVLKPAPLTEAYRKYIRGVVAFGDPTFTVGQSFNAGNATKSGIFSRGGDSLALLSTYSSVVKMYCMIHDTVCAKGNSLAVHSAEVSTFATNAANFVASLNR